MTPPRLIKSIGRSSSRLALLLIPLVLVCFALSPMAQAVSPPPDGGYPGQNTAEGDNALFNLSPTDGSFNTAIGWVSLFSNTTGSLNTGVGAGTLFANTSHNNTAVGAGALALNTEGSGNTANGALALLQNTVGRGNTAVGAATLLFNTEGSGNTAVGAQALQNNAGVGDTAGNLNTAVGVGTLTSNTVGQGNTAVGAGPGVIPQPSPDPPLVYPSALGSNTTGDSNTAVGGTDGLGPAALGRNTEGAQNTAVGAKALGRNTTGGENTAIGASALKSNTEGSGNIAVGFSAGGGLTTGSSNIHIGNFGQPGESATIRIGTRGTQTATYIAGILGTEIPGGTGVVIDDNGRLGVKPSSMRFKEQIKPMDKVSEAILALKPVTFHYKSDTKGTPQFGLIAEEVAEVNPDLILRDNKGDVYTVRYEAVNAMLLNEFLKEHKTVQEQGATITRLQKQIEALTAGLQKVSAQVQMSRPAPQTVANNQ